jgi:hypothetical protein
MALHERELAALRSELVEAKRSEHSSNRAQEIAYRITALETDARNARAEETARSNAAIASTGSLEQLTSWRSQLAAKLAELGPMDPARREVEGRLTAIDRQQAALASSPPADGPTAEQRQAARATYVALQRRNPIAAAAFAARAGDALFGDVSEQGGAK